VGLFGAIRFARKFDVCHGAKTRNSSAISQFLAAQADGKLTAKISYELISVSLIKRYRETAKFLRLMLQIIIVRSHIVSKNAKEYV
jgi:hypothetical protein